MPYFLIGYHPGRETLTHFEIFDDHREALPRLQMMPGFPIESVVIDAPDLHRLMSLNRRYFASSVSHHITDCFFCRSYLDSRGIHLLEIELLQQAGFKHGHCIFCHHPYPIAGMWSSDALRFHLTGCEVLSDIET